MCVCMYKCMYVFMCACRYGRMNIRNIQTQTLDNVRFTRDIENKVHINNNKIVLNDVY